MGKRWSRPELEILRIGINNKKSSKQISQDLLESGFDRSVKAIQEKACVSPEYGKRKPRAKKFWTSNEIKNLIRLTKLGHKTGQIAGQLGRTKTCVRVKLCSLGITRKNL